MLIYVLGEIIAIHRGSTCEGFSGKLSGLRNLLTNKAFCCLNWWPFKLSYLSVNTAKRLFSGHLQEIANLPPDRGWPLKRGVIKFSM